MCYSDITLLIIMQHNAVFYSFFQQLCKLRRNEDDAGWIDRWGRKDGQTWHDVQWKLQFAWGSYLSITLCLSTLTYKKTHDSTMPDKCVVNDKSQAKLTTFQSVILFALWVTNMELWSRNWHFFPLIRQKQDYAPFIPSERKEDDNIVLLQPQKGLVT